MRNRGKRNRKNRKIRQKTGSLFARVFCGMIVLLMAVNLLVPDREYSSDENRRLAGRPRITPDSLISGTFVDKYETYLTDQFAGRALLRKLRVTVDRLGGGREENGVLFGRNGQLLEQIVVPDQENLTDNLDAIRAFAEANPDLTVSMMLVPDAANVLNDSLPALAVVADQKRMIAQVKRELEETINWIDVESILSEVEGEQIYYKTDKYWTSGGAYAVFQESAQQLGITGSSVGRFATYPITTTFHGGLAARSGYERNVREVIEIYTPTEGDADVVVNYVDEQRKTTSLYDSAKLESADQYDVFLGGDTSVIDIKTASDRAARLLVIKDSFANSFIPLLAPYYREIVVVDPRYYGGTIEDIMDTYRITDALFLYGGNTFFQDNHISGVLSSE